MSLRFRNVRAVAILFFFTLASAASAATYYIDAASGNDANDGASKATAWSRAPGMQGFAGTYAADPTDQIIFKGGVTWPNADFPLIISNGRYYGVDTSWFAGGCGASFCRPVFDMQASSVAMTNVAVVINTGVTNITVDNLEIRNLYWTGPAPAGAIQVSSGTAIVAVLKNLYIHNWTHDPGNGTLDVFRAVTSTSPSNVGLYSSEITGFPSSNSGTGVDGISFVSSCSIHDVSSGWVVHGILVTLLNSRLFNINASFDGVSPSRPLETTGVSLIVSNYIYNFSSTIAGITTQPSHSNVLGDDAIYNNLVWNTGAKTPFVMDTQGPTSASASPYFFNNTIVQDTNGYCLTVGKTNSGTLGTLTYANNFCISDKNPRTSVICTSAEDAVNCATYAGLSAPDNILESHAAATSDGYTLADLFSPTASTSPTVDHGLTNNAIQATTDIRGVHRAQGASYDVGAYEYCSGCGFAPSTLPVAVMFGLPQSGTAPLTVNFDASRSTTPVGSIVRYDWVFGDGQTALNAGPTVSHTYTFSGNFASSVTITTDRLAQGSSWGFIVVLSSPPVVVSTSPAVLTIGNATVLGGSDVSLDVTFTPSTQNGTTAFQFDLALPSWVTFKSAILVGAGSAASKEIDDNTTIPRVLVFGLNQTSIGAGVVLTLFFHVAADAPAKTLSIDLVNLVAGDANSNPIPLNGVSGSITVTPSGSGGFSPGVFPSPWRSDIHSGIPLTFDGLAGVSTIKIFTTSGHLVKMLSTSGTSTAWYRDNASGDQVASGLYFYVITNDLGQKATGKFVIIK